MEQRIKHLGSKEQADDRVIKQLSKLKSSISESRAETDKNRLKKINYSPVAGVTPVCKRISPNFDFKF